MIRVNRIWQILYPVCLYFLCYNLLYSLFRFLLSSYVSPLFCLMLAAGLTIPLIYQIYRKLPIVRCPVSLDKNVIRKDMGYVFCIAAVGILLNVLFTQIGFVDKSLKYQQANTTLYSGTLPTKILANAVLIPFLEETLYRGIVCGQMDTWYGKSEKWYLRYLPVFFSAVLFGMMHFNMVQFTYAFCVGIVIGFIYVKTHKLSLCVLGHMLTNLIIVIYSYIK